MKLRVSVAIAIVGILSSVSQAQAQSGKFPVFPYCLCNSSLPGAYSLEPAVIAKATDTFCFKVKVEVPPGCTSYCCTRADLKKLELNVNPSCKVPGVSAVATINGIRTKVAPVIEKAAQGLPSSMILKLTQMGLNLTTADGAEICITLRPNRAGLGCTTLEQLCVPPPGFPNGTCSTALFDSTDDCCPLKEINIKPCKTCVYFSLKPPDGAISRPYSFTPSQCANLATVVAKDIKAQATGASAAINGNFSLVSCEDTQIKVCGNFASDADGAKLKPFIDDMAIAWLSQVTGNLSSSCPTALSNYTVMVTVGGDGTDSEALPPSCLEATTSTACKPNPFPFPKCVCNITQGISPFAPTDLITELPGRRSQSVLYCFLFKVVDTIPGQPCANATTFQKVEFWANEAVRTKILGFSLRPAGAAVWKNISTSWGGKGEETLKATPIGWNLGQANGGHVCVEVDRSVSLDTLCLGPTPNTCWVNIFDPSRTCCPMYPTYFTL